MRGREGGGRRTAGVLDRELGVAKELGVGLLAAAHRQILISKLMLQLVEHGMRGAEGGTDLMRCLPSSLEAQSPSGFMGWYDDEDEAARRAANAKAAAGGEASLPRTGNARRRGSMMVGGWLLLALERAWAT